MSIILVDAEEPAMQLNAGQKFKILAQSLLVMALLGGLFFLPALF